MIGSTVSHYEILESLDRGDMGRVYKARDTRRDHLVSLRLLPSPGNGSSARAVRELSRRARAVSALDHPHICPVYEVGDAGGGQLFVALAFSEGEETLRGRLERGPLDLEVAIGLASQIAAALGRMHEQKIVHGGIHPGNLLVTADGQAKVVGFVGPASALPGPLAYRAPEQLRGEGIDVRTDARTDVWALGAVLYEMVTGRSAFRGASREELVEAILERDPEPMSALHPGVPEKLEDLVLKALAKAPEDRHERVDELLVGLRGLLGAGLSGSSTGSEATVVEVPALRYQHATATPGRSEAEKEDPLSETLTGQMVAHYRIVGRIGGGTMGKVYKAEDTRLRRTVALKFLPTELTRDAGAKAWFLQEAQAASALDHPNVCTVHEIGETADGHLYLSMACYDGETVRAKIQRGPLAVAEAVEIAKQVAHGLAKAHRHGIVHRDIKPANLMVTADGVVKILDFGIAKLRGEAGLSLPGSFLGTPAYMSPEQARGEEVDARTDVWSLGVVLYEMLAGERPFPERAELTAMLHALLREQPRPLSRLRPEVPAGLERVVTRLLAKVPAERPPTAAEAHAEIAAFQAELSATAAAQASRRPVWLGLAALALTFSVLAAWLWSSRAEGPPRGAFSRLTDMEGREEYPSLSPDGTAFLYAKTIEGDSDLFLRPVEGGEPLNLTADSPADDTQPAFSPDGRRIAFRSERDGGGIFLAASPAGSPPGNRGEKVRRLADFGFTPAWSPDGGTILVATEAIGDPGRRKSDSQLWRIDVRTGARRRLLEKDAVQPSWSPHGWRIAYWGLPPNSDRRVLWTIPAEGGAPSTLLDDGNLNWNPVWSPDGRYIYFGSDRGGSRNLWRLPVDERTGKVKGEPQPVTTPSTSSGFWSLSADGRRIVYAANESKSNLERLDFDPARLKASGAAVPVTRGSHDVRSSDLSPDGRRIAFHAALPSEDLFVVGVDGAGLRQVTRDRFKDRHPFWSPDGTRLLFYSNRGGSYEPWLVRPDGGGLEKVVAVPGQAITYPIWAPDGRRVACSLESEAVIVDLAEPAARRKARPLPAASAIGEAFYPAAWSPGGRILAGNMARLDESILEGVGLFDFGTMSYERLTNRGNVATWLRDGRTLLYLDAGKVVALDTVARRSRDVLAPPPGSVFTSAGVSPDGRGLYVIRGVDEGDIWMLTIE